MARVIAHPEFVCVAVDIGLRGRGPSLRIDNPVSKMRPKALECGGKTARRRFVELQSGAMAPHSKALRAPKSKRWLFTRLGGRRVEGIYIGGHSGALPYRIGMGLARSGRSGCTFSVFRMVPGQSDGMKERLSAWMFRLQGTMTDRRALHLRRSCSECKRTKHGDMGIEIVRDEAQIRLPVLISLGTNHTVFARLLKGGAGAGELKIRISRDWRECFGTQWIYLQDLTLGKGQVKLH